ncbi:MAG: hypothetical protein IPJ77_12020 [Planctomycetes bacterium]|nr:hypothetical protein [Planctomycetota bacterium]
MSRGRVTAAFVWPCALVIGVALAGWMALRPRAELDVRAPRLGSDAPAETFGLEGRIGALGARVRVAALHVEPRRQAFEARALRRRFDEPAGEPFRLQVLLDEGARPVQIDFARITVVDAGGLALRPLLDAPAAAGGAADPLRTLLAAGRVELAPGGVAECVLWGRLPADGAALGGLAEPACALAPTRWPVAPLDDVLARVPAPPAEEAGR